MKHCQHWWVWKQTCFKRISLP